MKAKYSLMLLLFAAVIALPFMSAAENSTSPILSEQIAIRTAHIELMTFEKQAEMNASINYTKSIGANASSLASILHKFENKSASIKNMTSHSDIDSAVKELNSLLNEFKTELQGLVAEHNGKTLDLAESIQNALDKNANKIRELESNYINIKQENIPLIFAERIENLAATLENLENSGVEIKYAERKFAEIKLLEEPLKQAVIAKNDSLIEELSKKALSFSKDIQNLTLQEQTELAEGAKLDSSIALDERMIKRIKAVNSELKDLGINVTELKGLTSNAGDNIGDAKDALDDGNLSEAKNALADMQNNVDEIAGLYEKFIPRFFWSKSILPSDMEGKIKATIILLKDSD